MSEKSFELQYNNIGNIKYPSKENDSKKNNIFLFATKELAQDAFIAWCLNMFNSDEQKQKKLALAFLNRILKSCSKSQNIKTDDITNFTIKLQHNRIDILISFTFKNEEYFIIIEDKTNTSESENQINKYKEKIKHPDNVVDNNIITVYCKTGFWFPNDFAVKSDVKLDSFDLYDILAENINVHALVENYVCYLQNKFYEWNTHKTLIDNLTTCKQLDSGNIDTKNTATISSHIGQCFLISKLFSETCAKLSASESQNSTNDSSTFTPDFGSSRGSNYAQLKIFEYKISNILNIGKDESFFKLFWRIGCYSKGWYISLKSYTYSKNNSPTNFDSCSAHNIIVTYISSNINSNEIIRSSDSHNERQLVTFYFKNYDTFNELKEIVNNISNNIISQKGNIELELENLPPRKDTK